MLTQENPDPSFDSNSESDPSFRARSEAGYLDLIQQLLEDITTWIRLEGQLARTEVSEKAGLALRGLVIGVAGAILLICSGIGVLLAVGFAVSGALEQAGVNPAYSNALGFLISGLAGAFAAWFVLQKSKAILSPSNLAPSRTVSTLHSAVTWMGSKLKLSPSKNHE